MKKILYIAILFFAFQAKSQTYNINKSVTVYTVKLKKSKAELDNFISSKATKLIKSEQDESTIKNEFIMPINQLKYLDSLVLSFGYITENNFNTENVQDKINQIESDILDEQKELDDYKQRLDKSKNDNTNTEAFENSIERIEKNIKRLKKNLREMDTKDSSVFVKVKIQDEITYANPSSSVSYVNMPGFEVGYLFVENPKMGLSSNAYQTYSCKYMFTRGKSYFNLGVYKDAYSNNVDSSRIRELFILNFGQDFYPKHFGRGKRKFLNLYTGYQIGGFIANKNNDNSSSLIPNANLTLGLELYKSKYILIDNKASYFLPLNEMNRNLRGIIYNISFNFVF